MCFTLANHIDDPYFPHRDSSGSALYQTEQQARSSALNEYAERQSLPLFWYYGHCNSALDTSEINLSLLPKKVSRVVAFLNSTGKVILFDTSIFCPLRSILAIYISDRPPVFFSSGGSSSSDLDDAIEKACMELYQAYALMLQMCDADRDFKEFKTEADPVVKGYLGFNQPKTVTEFKCRLARVSPDNFFSSKTQWIKEIETVELLERMKIVRWVDGCLFLSVIRGIHGFPAMSLNAASTMQVDSAAAYYGYSKKICGGRIPFS